MGGVTAAVVVGVIVAVAGVVFILARRRKARGSTAGDQGTAFTNPLYSLSPVSAPGGISNPIYDENDRLDIGAAYRDLACSFYSVQGGPAESPYSQPSAGDESQYQELGPARGDEANAYMSVRGAGDAGPGYSMATGEGAYISVQDLKTSPYDMASEDAYMSVRGVGEESPYEVASGDQHDTYMAVHGKPGAGHEDGEGAFGFDDNGGYADPTTYDMADEHGGYMQLRGLSLGPQTGPGLGHEYCEASTYSELPGAHAAENPYMTVRGQESGYELASGEPHDTYMAVHGLPGQRADPARAAAHPGSQAAEYCLGASVGQSDDESAATSEYVEVNGLSQ